MPQSWQPFQIQELPEGQGVLFHNDRYHVIVRKLRNPQVGWPDIVHLSIRDNERTAKHDWRDFQRIKNQIIGPEAELVEVYPRESQLVDLSNQYHLFGFLSDEPVFTKLGLCWEQGRCIWDGDPATKPDVPNTENAVQRPITETADGNV
jgi:hypothetical protein